VHHGCEAPGIVFLALVEASRLLVKVCLQMLGGNPKVGPPDRALEQTPEVLQAVRMHPALDIAARMVYLTMNEPRFQAAIRP
jgi:hypothetical protein